MCTRFFNDHNRHAQIKGETTMLKRLSVILILVFSASLALADKSKGENCNESAKIENSKTPMTEISVQKLKDEFNRTSDKVRFVSILSPTCPMCQKGHGVVKDV